MAPTIVGLMIFGGCALFFFWLGRRGIQTGQAAMKFTTVERATQPALFWIATVLNFAMAAGCGYGFVAVTLHWCGVSRPLLPLKLACRV